MLKLLTWASGETVYALRLGRSSFGNRGSNPLWPTKCGILVCMSTPKYTVEELEQAVQNSFSTMEVMRKLNIKMAGGSHSHLKNKINKMGIDTSHFTRQAHNKGKVSTSRKTPEEIFVVFDSGSYRPKVHQLRRAMLEVGIEYRCSICSISSWNGKQLVLEIDHIDGEWLNNLKENLRFVCPNCHSQQETTNKPHKNK